MSNRDGTEFQGLIPPTLYVAGDSRSTNSLTDVPSNVPNILGDAEWVRWFVAAMQGRVRIVYNSAVVGATSADMLAAMQNDINRAPGFVSLLGCANDPGARGILQGLTPAISAANVLACARIARSWGAVPILFTESPQSTAVNSGVGQNADYLFTFNALIRATAQLYNFPLVDLWPLNIDASKTTGAAKLNVMVDSLHFSSIGARALGFAAASVIKALNKLPPDGYPHATSMSDTPGANASTRQALPNPLFQGNNNNTAITAAGLAFGVVGTNSGVVMAYAAMTAYAINIYRLSGSNVYRVTTAGTTGAASAPTGTGSGIVDGTVVWTYVATIGTNGAPNNWLTGPTVGAGALAAVFVEARADGLGNNLCFLMTATAAGDTFEINSNGFQGNLTKGDTLSSEIFISQIEASAVDQVSFQHTTQNATLGVIAMGVQSLTFDNTFYDQTAYTDLCFAPQPILIPAGGGALQSTLAHVIIKFAAAGYAMIKVARAQALH